MIKLRSMSLAALFIGIVGVSLVACGGETATPVQPTVVVTSEAGSEGTATPVQPTVTAISEIIEGSVDTPTAEGSVDTPTAAVETQIPEAENSVASPTASEDSAPLSTSTTISGDATANASCAKLNLNELTEAQLMATIPNFSSRMVREFFEYRPYVSIQEFRKEIGKYVDAGQVAEYEKYVYVPVNANSSDAATLMQLPGVDNTVAEALIAARPYASNDVFLQALAAKVSAEQLAQAKCYLATQ